MQLRKFYVGAYVKVNDDSIADETVIPLVVEQFLIVGGEGSPTHGDPRYVMMVPLVRQLMADQNRPRPSSFRTRLKEYVIIS